VDLFRRRFFQATVEWGGGAGGSARLRAKLDAAVAAGRIWYGLDVSEECRMTCLVFVRGRQHFHFVDGSGGGDAATATALKAAKVAAAERA
jgi:hypothetical protein